jgi:hypothetical protein
MITAAALTFPRLQATVTSSSRQRDAPVRRTAATCNDTQITIYNCRNRSTAAMSAQRKEEVQ